MYDSVLSSEYADTVYLMCDCALSSEYVGTVCFMCDCVLSSEYVGAVYFMCDSVLSSEWICGYSVLYVWLCPLYKWLPCSECVFLSSLQVTTM